MSIFTFQFFFVVTTLSVCSCSNYSKTTNEGPSSNMPQRAEDESRELISLILLLPVFRYHEESKTDFEKRLFDNCKHGFRSELATATLVCPGDGTFPKREFSWNKKDQILKVKTYPTEIDAGQTDYWGKIDGKLHQIYGQKSQ